MRSWLSRISLFGASAAAVDKAVHELAPPAVLETLEQRRLMSASASDVAALPPAALAAASSNASSSFDVSGLYEGTFKAKVDGKRQTVRFQLTVSQVGRKLTGRVTAGGLNVQFVGHLQKNQFKLVLDGSPAAGVAVGRVGRNGEKLGGVITFSDGGDVIKGKFSAVEGATPLTSSAPRVIIGGENTGGGNTGGGTTTPGTGGTTDPGPTTPVDTGGGGAVVDPGEGLPPGFPDGPPAEEPPTEPPPGGDPGQLPPPTDPIDGPVDPGTLPPGNGGTGGSNNNGTGGTPGGGTGGSVNNVGEPGTMVGNNWGIIGRFNGVFNGRVAKVDPAAPNNPNFRVGTDDRNTVMRVTSQTDDGAIAGTIQVEGVGTFGWTGFINGRVFDFVLDNGAGEGNGRVSDNRRGLAGDLLVETSGYRAKGHYAVVWDGVIVGPGPGPGPGTPGWDVIESNAEDGILIGDLATAMDLSDDGDIQNQTGNDPDPDDEDDVQQYNVPTLEYPPELFRTFAAGADNIVIDALGIADVVAPAGNGMFTIGVTSDDGFAVFVNDVEVLSAAGPRVAGTVVTTAPVAISDGDEIRVIYYENFGSDGELNVFIRTATGDFAIGDPASGVVVTVPGTTPPPPPPPPPPPGGPPPPPPPPPVGPPPTGPLSSYPGGVVRTPTGPGIFGGNSGEVPVDEAPPV